MIMYIGKLMSESFYASKNTPESAIQVEMKQRINRIEKEYPDYEYWRRTSEISDVPRQVQYNDDSVIIGIGYVITLHFKLRRKTKPSKEELAAKLLRKMEEYVHLLEMENVFCVVGNMPLPNQLDYASRLEKLKSEIEDLKKQIKNA